MTEIDTHIGARIRGRRTAMKMSQSALAEAIGVRFQQIQKYERGMNRVSAGRLLDVAKALQVSLDYFFEGQTFDASAGRRKPVQPAAQSADPKLALKAAHLDEIAARLETLPEHQQLAVLEFLRSMTNVPQAVEA